MIGSRGKVRAVQVQEAKSEKECLASVTEVQTMAPLPKLEASPEDCLQPNLPNDLAAIQPRIPVSWAFHVHVEPGNIQRLVAGELVTHNLFSYTFDPGPQAEVCERLSKQFCSAWVKVKCTPPRAV
jgi:hypothetical protein